MDFSHKEVRKQPTKLNDVIRKTVEFHEDLLTCRGPVHSGRSSERSSDELHPLVFVCGVMNSTFSV